MPPPPGHGSWSEKDAAGQENRPDQGKQRQVHAAQQEEHGDRRILCAPSGEEEYNRVE